MNNFEKNIFINCPFDSDYKRMLWILLFTIIICELEPRIAIEREDSGEERIDKIKELIKCSKYSIHDISRMEPLEKGDLPRFNMPFELGLDLGCRTYGEGRLKTKKCLILEKEKYRYMKVISDISGNDIRNYNFKEKILIRKLRNWIRSTTKKPIPGANKIWQDYNIFYSDLIKTLNKRGFDEDDIEEMPITEFIYFLKEWITETSSILKSKKRSGSHLKAVK